MGLKDIYTIKQARYVAYGLQGERTFLLPLNEDTRILSGLTESVLHSDLPTPTDTLSDDAFERLCRDVVKWQASHFFDNKAPKESSYIPPSGKIVDKSDLSQLIDASLDMWLTAGRFNTEFETKLQAFMGIKFAISTNSGSSANLLAMSALTSPSLGARQLKAGDEVLTLAAGFPTTVVPIIQNNLTPVFVDVDIRTHNVDVEALKAAVSPKTKAIFIAHTLGNPYNVAAVKSLANEHGLWLIEDNCDALGATYDGQLTGTFGDLSTLSFYPAHHMTMGEGGAVLTSNALLKKIILSMRDWGRDCWCEPGESNACSKRFGWQLGSLPESYDHKYTYSHLGYNLKVTDWQAAIGITQLEKVPNFIQKRRANYDWLQKELAIFPHLKVAKETDKAKASWFGLVLTVTDDAPFTRLALTKYLEKNGVGTRLVFGGNLLRQPFCTTHDFSLRIGNGPLMSSTNLSEADMARLPFTEQSLHCSFWIGVWPGIETNERKHIVDTFSAFYQEQL
jgi:CDP-4-dehydro-6-deoxyglucose reductase, E1